MEDHLSFEKEVPPFSCEFPDSISILEELKELASLSQSLGEEALKEEKEKEIPECFLKCEQLLVNINVLEKVVDLQMQAKRNAAVIIGNRRNSPVQRPTGIRKSLSFEASQKISDKIAVFLGGQLPPVRTKEVLSFPSPRNLSRSSSIWERPVPSSNSINFLAEQQNDLFQRLSDQLENLVDDCPQEKLLQVFSKHQRTSNQSRTAWSAYFNSVSTGAPSSSKTRKSIRYGNQDRMNSFLEKRKSGLLSADLKTQRIVNPSLFGAFIGDDEQSNFTEEDEELSQYRAKFAKPRVGCAVLAPPKKKTVAVNVSSRNLRRRITLDGRTVQNEELVQLIQNQPKFPPPQRPTGVESPKSPTSSPLQKEIKTETKEEIEKEELKDENNIEENSVDESNKLIEEKVEKRDTKVLNISDVEPTIRLRSRNAIKRRKGSDTASVPADLRQSGEDWQAQLRSAWTAEIGSMSSTKRAWYDSKEEISMTPPKSHTSKLRRKLGGGEIRRDKVKIYMEYTSILSFYLCILLSFLDVKESFKIQRTIRKRICYLWNGN